MKTALLPGVWTLEQQAEFVKQGIWPIAGNVPNYIEDVFSTWLYTGNGTTQTITNGIDLAGKGGLVWSKARSTSLSNFLCDTVRGRAFYLYSNNTFNQAGPSSAGNDITAFNSNGYSLGPNQNADINNGSATFVSWTFREQPKFFDVVTYTGNGATFQTLSHNLGSTPGCIIVKKTNNISDWWVRHRSETFIGRLNLTNTFDRNADIITNLTSTTFDVGVPAGGANTNGDTYVAYLFAHNAGGFGLSGTDNVISCGSFTGGSDVSVTLGYEPQWLLTKKTNEAGGGWNILDNMRGWNNSGSDQFLQANTSGAETTFSGGNPTATGFNYSGDTGNNVIYIAIRRGPMRTPTTGTSVFNAITRTGTGAAATISGIGFAPDFVYPMCRNDIANKGGWVDKLRGASANLTTNLTDAESTNTNGVTAFGNTSISVGTSSFFNSALNYVNYFFVRAPGFFDVVCYTGTGANRTVTHNLAAVPELMIVKARSVAGQSWTVYYGDPVKSLELNSTSAAPGSDTTSWNSTAPTTSVFTVGTSNGTNGSAVTYVAYLFASAPGVSKVGSFTGTGATQVINCGFTAGARFVLIKATSTTGNWLVWDSARGIVAGNDPYLALNSTAAEVTGTDWVDTAATGFELSNAGGNLANSNGVSYIFLAIS